MNGNTSFPASDDRDEAPVWTAEDFHKAVRRVGLKPVLARKQKINIALDPDVLAWFRQQAGGRGYQTLINAALRDAMREKSVEDAIRRVIREELHPA
ncbi:MAG: BrnA antitoxin family protein [Rhodocyclaceae bacterium]